MVSIFQINALNSYFSLFIGICMNIFLLFLSKKYSSSELKEYRSAIKFLAFLNISLLILQTITQPLYFMADDSISFIFVQNITGSASVFFRNIITILYIHSFNMIMVTLSLQFVHRYFIICCPKIGEKFRKIFLASAFFISEILGFFTQILLSLPERDISSEEIPADLREQFTANELAQLKIAMKFDPKKPYFQIGYSVILILVLLCYLAIIFCYSRIRKFLKSNIMGNITAQKQKTIKQISLNMMLQAILPIYCIFLATIGILSMLIGIQNSLLNQLEILIFAPFNWLPILNPLVTILTIYDYRIGLLKLLGIRKETRCITMAVAGVNGQIQLDITKSRYNNIIVAGIVKNG